jgi:hypothetical protein
MPPPTISLSTLPSRLSSTVSFVETFGPPTIATSGRFGLTSAFSSASSSLTAAGRRRPPARLAHAVRARFGAVRRREGVHDVDVAERRHLLRQLVLVLLLALVEAHVLEQHDLAGSAVDAVEPVALEAHLAAEQFDRRAATGASENSLAARPPPAPEVGHDSTRAPALRAASIVGSAARMRASLVTTPFWTGTLRSSRIRTPLASQFQVGHSQHTDHVRPCES